MIGPGKYDAACTKARELSGGGHVILMVIGGPQGSGCSIQSDDPLFPIQVPMILLRMAEAVEEDLAKVHTKETVDSSVNNG